MPLVAGPSTANDGVPVKPNRCASAVVRETWSRIALLLRSLFHLAMS